MSDSMATTQLVGRVLMRNKAERSLATLFREFLMVLALTFAFASADHGFAQTAAPPAEATLSADRAKSDALTQELREQARRLFETAFGLLQSGDVQAAKVGFERGLAIDPANVIANFYMAEALVRLGENSKARIFYNRVIAFASDSAEALKARAALSSLANLDTQVAATPALVPRGGDGMVPDTNPAFNGGSSPGTRDVAPDRPAPPAEERTAPPAPERWNSAAAAIWRYRGQVHVAIGYSGTQQTADDARASALDACRNAGGSGCKAIGAWNSGCLYITTGRSSNRAGWGSGGSVDAALKKCRSYGFSCKAPIGGCVD